MSGTDPTSPATYVREAAKKLGLDLSGVEVEDVLPITARFIAAAEGGITINELMKEIAIAVGSLEARIVTGEGGGKGSAFYDIG